MPKVSPRDAAKMYMVSRATLMRALIDGKISAEKTDAGHWRIDPAELARVYLPRVSKADVGRTKPDQVNRSEPDQKTDVGHDISARLAIAEAALDAEREKTAMLQRHLDDVRRMLPPPEEPALRKKSRSWWPWDTNR